MFPGPSPRQEICQFFKQVLRSHDDELLDLWMARMFSAVIDKMVVNNGNNQVGVAPLQGRNVFFHVNSRVPVANS